MLGGIPPELAWESLHLLEHEVLPRLVRPSPSGLCCGTKVKGGNDAAAGSRLASSVALTAFLERERRYAVVTLHRFWRCGRSQVL